MELECRGVVRPSDFVLDSGDQLISSLRLEVLEGEVEGGSGRVIPVGLGRPFRVAGLSVPTGLGLQLNGIA